MNIQNIIDKFPEFIEKTDLPEWSYKTEKNWHHETKFHLRSLLKEIEFIHEKIINCTSRNISKRDLMAEEKNVKIWQLEAMIIYWKWALEKEIEDVVRW